MRTMIEAFGLFYLSFATQTMRQSFRCAYNNHTIIEPAKIPLHCNLKQLIEKSHRQSELDDACTRVIKQTTTKMMSETNDEHEYKI